MVREFRRLPFDGNSPSGSCQPARTRVRMKVGSRWCHLLYKKSVVGGRAAVPERTVAPGKRRLGCRWGM